MNPGFLPARILGTLPRPFIVRLSMTRLLLLIALFLSQLAHAGQPVAEPVAENLYALVGPLGQRSAENDGLNANYGFIVTPRGMILIDSGASRLGAEKLAAAIRAVTSQPVRWVINTGSPGTHTCFPTIAGMNSRITGHGAGNPRRFQ
jgi:hypothetical protein